MPAVSDNPKVQVGCSVTPEMKVAIEEYALQHGAVAPTNEDGTPKIHHKSGLEMGPEIAPTIFDAICAHIGYTPEASEKPASSKSKEDLLAEQRARDAERRKAANDKLAALRAKNRQAQTAALAEGAENPN
jgi:hypothetical protein